MQCYIVQKDFHWKRGEWELAFHSFEKSDCCAKMSPLTDLAGLTLEVTGDLIVHESLEIAVGGLTIATVVAKVSRFKEDR